MADRDRKRDFQRARELARDGEVDSALRIFMHHGDYMESARVLAENGRFLDAGDIILNSINTPARELEFLDGARKKQVFVAATYLAKAGEPRRAAQVMVAIGRRERAAEVLERSGDMVGAERLRRGGQEGRRVAASPTGRVGMSEKVSEGSARQLEAEGKLELAAKAWMRLRKPDQAGRVLRKLGRLGEAGKVFEEAGLHFEATVCYLEAGDAERGINAVTWVPSNHPRYRTAAAYAVRLATYANQMSFKLESFLAPFVKAGPQVKAEVETFYLLAKLFEKHDLVENAKEALRKIMERASGYRDAGELLERLESQTRMRPEQMDKIRQEQEAFLRNKTPVPATPEEMALPGLPPLPDLDDPTPLPAELPTRDTGTAETRAAEVSDAARPAEVDSMAGTQPRGELKRRDSAVDTRLAAAEPEQRDVRDDFEVGGIIADRYKLVGKIGQGGMAVVYRATDLDLEEEIALKVFFLHLPDKEVQEECMARFKLELKLNRQITHRNVLKLYDIGLHMGHLFISMELLVGHPLNELLAGEPMDFNEGLGYLIQACEGLESAHNRGVVHRDMKPENLFITDDGEVKVMDFGIAKNTLTKGMTVAGRIAGTPQYMAPEQIQNFSAVGPSADIYSVGIMAYELFTGRLPFWHEEIRAVYQMQLMSKPMPPRELNPDMPEELERVILRLLNKEPEGRHASCKALAADLERVRMKCLGRSNLDLWG